MKETTKTIRNVATGYFYGQVEISIRAIISMI